ncbi:MAG TPA: LysR substrate-binding domain-containing protein [Polyangiaceae bacterium]|nr:LysR substrate-binding domain-containing protein [Polyangiaceae bacterium]
MRIEQLEALVKIAETGSIGKAAQQMGVSQPAISVQIRQLEDELDALLLVREQRGARLTEAGAILRRHAERAIREVNEAIAAVHDLNKAGDEKSRATLRVGYSRSHLGICTRALGMLLASNPRLEVKLEEADAALIERRVANGRLDVGLIYAPVRASGVEVEEIAKKSHGVIVSRANKAMAGAKEVTLQDLAGQPLALPRRGLRVRDALDEYFRANDFSPRIAVETDTATAVLSLVREGGVFSILPAPELVDDTGLLFVPLSPRPPVQVTVLLWRTGAPKTRPIRAFESAVRELLRAK